jgi:glucokinase
MGYRLGIDLGGTKMLVALANERGEICSKHKFETKAAEGPHNVLRHLVIAVAQLLVKENIPQGKLDGLGLCVAGFYDIHAGKMYSSPNLPGWGHFPLKDELLKLFPLPVFIENDANAAAFGEYTFGAGRGKENLVQVTLGTGIGGGIIIKGKIYRGAAFAGEIGHLMVLPDGPLCGCGNRGCLEALSSGTALAREGRAALRLGIMTRLSQMVEKREDLQVTHVFEAAQEGDQVAVKIIERAAHYLGVGLANVVNILNPEMIVITGASMIIVVRQFNSTCQL